MRAVLLVAVLLGAATLSLAEQNQNSLAAEAKLPREVATTSNDKISQPRVKREHQKPQNKEQDGGEKKEDEQKKPQLHHPKRPAPKHWPKPHPGHKNKPQNKPPAAPNKEPAPNKNPPPPKAGPKPPVAKKPVNKKPMAKPHPHNKPHPVKKPHPVRKPNLAKKPHPHPAKRPQPQPVKKPHPVKRPWPPAHPKPKHHLPQHKPGHPGRGVTPLGRVRQHSKPNKSPHPSQRKKHPPQQKPLHSLKHPRPATKKVQPPKKSFHNPHRWYKPPVQHNPKWEGPVRGHTPSFHPILFPVPHYRQRNTHPSKKRERERQEIEEPTGHYKTEDRDEEITSDRSSSSKQEPQEKIIDRKWQEKEREYSKEDERTDSSERYQTERSQTRTVKPRPKYRQEPQRKQHVVLKKKPAPRQKPRKVLSHPKPKPHLHQTTQLIKELMEPLRHRSHTNKIPRKKVNRPQKEPATKPPPCNCDKGDPKTTPKEKQPCDKTKQNERQSRYREFESDYNDRSKEGDKFYEEDTRGEEDTREVSNGRRDNYLYDYIA